MSSYYESTKGVHKASLTPEQKEKIKKRRKDGVSTKDLARMFHASKGYILKILREKKND